MRNKRIMVITTVAVLAVLLGAAAWLVLPGSAQNTGSIPVTGRSSSGTAQVDKIAQQDQAANNPRFIRQWESPEEEQVLSNPALFSQAAHTGRVTDPGESPEEEYILSQQDKSVASGNVEGFDDPRK